MSTFNTRAFKQSTWKKAACAVTMAAAVTLSGQSFAASGISRFEESRQTQSAALDIMVARPLGIVVTGIGAVLFAVSLPFSALGGNVDEAAEALVVNPARETFTRCLGCTSAEQTSSSRELN